MAHSMLKVPGTCQDAVWLSGGTSTQYSNTTPNPPHSGDYTFDSQIESLSFLYFILGAMTGR